MNEAEPRTDAAAIVPRKTNARWIPAGLSGLVVILGVTLWTVNRDRKFAAPSATPPPTETTAPTTPEPDQQKPIFAIGTVTATDVPDDEAAKRFNLRVPISARSETPISVRDLVIEVRFYDRLADGAVLPTQATVRSSWKSAPANWREEGTETLEVEYTLAKPTSEVEEKSGRSYYGYLVRVYYEDQLQATEAAPLDLAERFPTPSIRPASEEP